jgi:hypothetical protein
MPTGSDPSLKTAARRRVLAHWRRLALPDCQHPACKYLGVPIDYRAPKGASLALDVDEIVPRWQGGRADDLANTRPTHAGCNRGEGARITNALRRARGRATRAEPITSRQWW